MTNNKLNLLIENAIIWAKSQIGSIDYCTKCLAFVEDSLERSNNIEIFGGDTAKESAELYEAYKKTSIPPKGAFVFYDCFGEIGGVSKNWGHVGLACDNGEIIHAWDKVRIDDYIGVEKLNSAPGWTQPRFIGWVPIERVLKEVKDRIW